MNYISCNVFATALNFKFILIFSHSIVLEAISLLKHSRAQGKEDKMKVGYRGTQAHGSLALFRIGPLVLLSAQCKALIH